MLIKSSDTANCQTSMANSPGEKFSSVTCQDIIGFQEYLKRLRSIDDSIILNINTTILTSSSQKEDLQNIKNCNNFHDKLKEAYESRDKAIQVCLTDATAKVSELKEAKSQNESDLNVLKELKRHQTRLRMIQKEITVEQIIQDRSLKALQERCRRYVSF